MGLNNISKTGFQAENRERPKTPMVIKGSLPAFLAGRVTSIGLISATGLIALNRFDKINNLPQDKIDIIHNAYDQILSSTELKDKGVKLIKMADEEAGFFKRLRLALAKPTAENSEEMVKKGVNAFCDDNYKQITMPQKQLSTCGFHEIGHIMNHHFSKLGRALQKMRSPVTLIPPLLLIYCALTRNKKPDENGKISTEGKINNFIRNNSGKLAFLALTPILLEEGMASIKGQELANKFLKDKNLIKAVTKNNCWAYLTYLIPAAGVGVGVWAARKIKDSIQTREEAKIKARHK